MAFNQAIQETQIVKVQNQRGETANDWLAVEEPLEISLQETNKQPVKVSITMRTPGNDSELAAGFLFTEGIIKGINEIGGIAQSQSLPGIDSNNITVQLAEGIQFDKGSLNRNFYTSSSCGVCGKASIDAIHTVSTYQNTESKIQVEGMILNQLPSKLREVQSTFDSTGGLHAAAIFNNQGELVAMREDVGRHNAVDKLIGHFLLSNNLPLNQHILLLSGRASFELLQKAAMAGIQVVCAVGAPSSLAVETAKGFNICLVGFLRDQRFNIYSKPEIINL